MLSQKALVEETSLACGTINPICAFVFKMPVPSFSLSSSFLKKASFTGIRLWVLKNWCFWTVMLEKTLESPLDYKEIQPVHSEGDQPWDFFGRNDAKAETSTLATSWEELTHWKRLWCWARLKAGGKGDYRGWDGWMASLTQWTWVWVNSGRWWWTGRPGVLEFTGLQRVGHSWVTELNWLKWSQSRLSHKQLLSGIFKHFPKLVTDTASNI